MVSGRHSGRVVERVENDLNNEADQPNSGAEATRSFAPPHRVGRRELDRIRTALSERDRTVLASIEACRYMTTTQVERLWFRDAGLTPLSAARSSRRALRQMRELGLVRNLERLVGGVRAGSAAFVWETTDVGGRLLHRRTRRRPTEPTVRHLDHVLAVTEVVVEIHEAAPGGEVQLVAVETEPASWRTIVTANGGREWLKPDLRVTVAVGEFELHWWVEVDRATEHRPTLSRKVETYVRAWRDGGEQRRSGVTPRVLWLVPNVDRARTMSAVLSGSVTPEGMFVVATSDQATEALAGRRL